ncbi:type 4a pilus biogenesis protein PilO [Moraxella sp. ZJ142]|uniref:type 4a pilus biogenesis protein PilO n=1 Tax=Moraxella marmotae TaxID=3344520 RepID=UPI0035D3F593
MTSMNNGNRHANWQNFWQELRQINHHNIATAPKAIQGTVLALLALLLILFAWLFLLAPNLQKRNAAKSQEQVLIAEFADKYQKVQQFDELERQLLAQNTALIDRLDKLPRRAPMTEIVSMINTQAQAVGVQIMGATVQAGREQEYYTERPIAVRAMGNYHALGKWLLALSNSGYLLTVHDFEIQAQTDNRLLLSMQIHTYQANKKTKLPTGQADDTQTTTMDNTQ